jgi:hypothetical protein
MVCCGSDDNDHTAMLILQNIFSEDQSTNQKILTLTALLLFYAQDAKDS